MQSDLHGQTLESSHVERARGSQVCSEVPSLANN